MMGYLPIALGGSGNRAWKKSNWHPNVLVFFMTQEFNEENRSICQKISLSVVDLASIPPVGMEVREHILSNFRKFTNKH